MKNLLAIGVKKKSFSGINEIKLNKQKKFKIKVTKKLHQQFIKFSGDDSPIHTDVKFCKKNKFAKPIGHAFLITVILSKIYGKYFPGGTELCLIQTCNFRKPFYVNDILEIIITPIKKKISLKILEITVIIYSKKKIIFDGEALFQLTLSK